MNKFVALKQSFYADKNKNKKVKELKPSEKKIKNINLTKVIK